MLTPSYMARLDLKTGDEVRCDAEDVEFWVAQWVKFPQDFDVRPIPEAGEIMVFERENGRVLNAFVTSGWPQLSGCPDTW